MGRLEELRQRYAESFPAKATELAAAWQAFLVDSAAGFAALHQSVHRLAGSASAYGFEELGVIAQRADDVLAKWSDVEALPVTLTEQLEPHVTALVAALRA